MRVIENDKSRTTILNGWGRNPSPLFLKIVITLNVYLAMSGLSCDLRDLHCVSRILAANGL